MNKLARRVTPKDRKLAIVEILRRNPDGLTIQQVAKLGKISRITATKFIHELLGEGKLREKRIGVYRILFLKERYIQSLRQEDIVEKLRKKIK